MLTENDTIISFNYDLVVEKLRDARNVRANQTPGLSGSKVDVVHPAPRVERAPGTCPLLKLHGSVNWQKFAADPSARVQPRDDDFALHCSPPQMAIATPGPSKMREADGFKCIWNLACDALKAAHAIVFVGFRFPETDAYALERLLGAIEENHPPPMTPALRLHVVLGEAGRHAKRTVSCHDDSPQRRRSESSKGKGGIRRPAPQCHRSRIALGAGRVRAVSP